jgi:hypothetical protein
MTLQRATLYRNDPRYAGISGNNGLSISSSDAYVEFEDENFDIGKLFESPGSPSVSFKISVSEYKKDGVPVLPIQGETYSWFGALGFLFSVKKVKKVDDDRYDVYLETSADRLIDGIGIEPLLATFLGDGKFELMQPYDSEMPKPVAIRRGVKRGTPIIKLKSYKSGGVLHVKDSVPENMEVGEQVEILVNWDPSAVGFTKLS